MYFSVSSLTIAIHSPWTAPLLWALNRCRFVRFNRTISPLTAHQPPAGDGSFDFTQNNLPGIFFIFGGEGGVIIHFRIRGDGIRRGGYLLIFRIRAEEINLKI